MTEDYLHYTWQYRLFNKPELHTQSGERLVIIQPGIYNRHGGPDFLDARLKIGDKTWVGHVEIHLKASDWNRHGHDGDAHYDNVILHVVYRPDREIFLHQPGDLPVFDLSGYLIGNQWEKYQIWLKNKAWIPCDPAIREVDTLTVTNWKDRLITERLEAKSNEFLLLLNETDGDWSEVLYQKLARNFGFKVNGDAMERLAQSIPLRILARHRSDPFQIEAMLFGQAGFLTEIFTDDYPADLQKEYLFLAKKYDLKPINHSAWNFGKLRPANFPTIRIAQFAALICQAEHLFSKLILIDDVSEIPPLFQIATHDYWGVHYRFDTKSTKSQDMPSRMGLRLGQDAIQNILVNTVAVMLFSYGKFKSEYNQIDKSLKLLEICDSEDNRIIRNWLSSGLKISHAGDSQALLQLFNAYCSQKRCLQCQIGLKLLKG
jgi:hypothetical protein